MKEQFLDLGLSNGGLELPSPFCMQPAGCFFLYKWLDKKKKKYAYQIGLGILNKKPYFPVAVKNICHGVEDDDAGGDEEERVGNPSQKRHEFVHKMLRFQGDGRLGVTHVQAWMECKMKRP